MTKIAVTFKKPHTDDGWGGVSPKSWADRGAFGGY